MRREDILQYLNKKVKLVLSNDYNYTGVIKQIGKETLKLFDKFDMLVSIHIESIFVISEVKE